MKALLVIDVQNDYFSGGKFTLWNSEATLRNIEGAIAAARAAGIPVIHMQHIVDPAAGPAPFFELGTPGAEIHARIRAAAPDGPVVVKTGADSFIGTRLEEVLSGLGVTELLVCGMMTHNCVAHTAISKSAEKYKVCVLPDCCTTVSEIIHLLALDAVSARVPLVPSAAALTAQAGLPA